MFLNLHGGEIVLIIIAALVILGPQRLPEYAAKLAHGVRYLRDLAEGAKGQIKAELGPGFEDVDWRQLDPRQYDPRRIVREALSTPSPGATPVARLREADGSDAAGALPEPGGGAPPTGRAQLFDPTLPTPYDVDAT